MKSTRSADAKRTREPDGGLGERRHVMGSASGGD